ncbi:hypothetical protein FJ959_18160 [Mesorhizobium sp. B2-2-4]|uniref:hypothetical protein n=1 Tax=unclassified Mesorhizobium TaxID=325217 RepID=UPI00112B0265|nr:MULTISPECIES: hypothetical protein [unclassified Mesorhizobium]TPM55333.1 hypothetical protein FJ959_18160 [Mesorhizobium sp. B2-2-4]TPM66300.1 hypothetical protein FJ965_14120 [Mesorhizobium sp. B2-2-1]TPN59919.1 hypothetical protein FJ984_30875 [Mesorhizobium sp. B1-1-3]
MNAVALSPNANRLRAVRASLAAIAPADWTRVHGEAGAFIEARGEMGELFVLARFDEASSDEIAFLCDAPDTVRFLLRLLDEAFGTIRTLKGEPARRNAPAGPPAASDPKNYAAECAMKCQEPAFKVFLEERHGLERPLTDARVAQKVRSLLGVTSRKDINEGGRASEAWKALRADFAAWLKAER